MARISKFVCDLEKRAIEATSPEERIAAMKAAVELIKLGALRQRKEVAVAETQKQFAKIQATRQYEESRLNLLVARAKEREADRQQSPPDRAEDGQ